MSFDNPQEYCLKLHRLLSKACVRFSYDCTHTQGNSLFIVCQNGNKLTDLILNWERKVIKNGIYIMFEKGETTAHGNDRADRIVRIGINREEDTLLQRLKTHYIGTMRRSVFRKHIGSCFLNPDNPDYRKEYETDTALLEQKISEYIQNSISFALIEVKDKSQRERLEEALISTISKCEECTPSESWLGKYCKESKISGGNLWNVQGLKATPLAAEEMSYITDNAVMITELDPFFV